MKTKTLNKLLKDYAKIFENLGFKLNPDFKKEYLHIKRMKTNGTKISFIKADKIKGLEENIKGFKVKPNDQEQREKYFTAVKPVRFLDGLLLCHSKPTLYREIADQFNKDFISTLKNKLVLYKGKDIGEQYNKFSDFSGCMGGCNKEYFDVYRDTENLQLATLKDEADTLLIRALLWNDKEQNTYWLDNSYEQRAINGDEEVRQEYQKKLIVQVLKHLQTLNKDFKKDVFSEPIFFKFGCSFAYKLNDEVTEQIEKDFNITIYNKVQRKKQTQRSDKVEIKEEETQRSKETLTLSPKIKDFNVDDYEHFPYSDTFQSIGKTYGKWHRDDNQGDDSFVCCRSTDGEDENHSGTNCECCDDRVTNEDYIRWSEIEGEMLCDECCTYIEERDDCCRGDNAIYNNYSGMYHYSNDLDR